MSWPTSPIMTLVDDSPPCPTASLFNSLQSGINNTLLGTYSAKGLTVDGTGGNTVTAPSGIKVSLAVTTWTLVAEFNDGLGAGTPQAKIYRGVSGELVIVTNATWTEANAPNGWTQDSAANNSYRYWLNAPGFSWDWKASGSGAWSVWSNMATMTTTRTTFALPVWTNGDFQANAHVLATGTAPTAAVGAAAAGGSINGGAPTGNDVRGLVSVHSGANLAGIICTVTLAGDYASKPIVIVSPAHTGLAAGDDGSTSAALSWYVGNVTINVAGHTTFEISCAGTTLTAGNDYGFAYWVIG